MYASKMTPTADGKGLLLSQDNSIFSFNCVSETNCAWTKTDIQLKIKRRYHVMLTVPAALVDQCECEDGYYGHTCESKLFEQSFLRNT